VLCQLFEEAAQKEFQPKFFLGAYKENPALMIQRILVEKMWQSHQSYGKKF
jgi:hypothetical protein